MRKELHGIVYFVASLWIIHAVDWLVPQIDLNAFGVVPRTLHGLIGVPAMTFLHANWGHLISNTIPLCILLFILASTRKDFWEVIGSVIVLGGLLLWCFGREAVHVGASLLIYGLVAFLIASGFAERKLVPMFVAIVVGFLYGTTLIWGMLPFVNAHVSWDGHLCGAVAGAATAYFLASEPSPEINQEVI